MPSYVGSQVHVDRPLSTFATSYENHELIGLRLCPEVMVDKPSDKYFQRNKRNALQYVNAKIGSLEIPPEIESGVSLSNFSCEDYGFIAKVAARDDEASDIPLNLRQDATMDAMALLRLAQEVRIKDLLTTTGNYDSNNVVTLSGSDQWNSSSGGDPLGVIDAYRAKVWPAPNTRLIAFCDLSTWLVLKRHAQVVDTIKGGATASTPAVVARQKFAELIEVDEFLVGEAYHTTTNPGAAASYSRIWPEGFGIVRVANGAPTTRSLHFASSMAWGGVRVSSWFEPGPGLSGVYKFKCTHSTDEKIVASDAGAFINDPLA